MTSVTWKCYWKTGALTYPESGREGEGCMPCRGREDTASWGCDGWVSTCKQRSEPQALLAVGNPTQMYNNSLHRCSTEVRAICTFVGILWDILQPFPASAWGNNIIFSSFLSCSILWDASCKNSFYVARSTWLLLLSTNQQRPASLSRRGGLCSGCREGNVYLKAFPGPLC